MIGFDLGRYMVDSQYRAFIDELSELVRQAVSA